MHQPIISLLTDFGLSDPYVGVMKGVMLGINPRLKFIDITHSIPQGDIKRAAFRLFTAYRYFPKNTIHLVVVDPGVGTKRKSIIVKTYPPQADGGLRGDESSHKKYYFVGPDNGVFSWIYTQEEFKIYRINSRSPDLSRRRSERGIKIRNQEVAPAISHTFHGRDIFAPTAAHLSLGRKPSELGKLINHWVAFKPPTPIIVGTSPKVGSLQGEIIDIDQFGNIITNISKFDFQSLFFQPTLLPAPKIGMEEEKAHNFLTSQGSRGFRGEGNFPSSLRFEIKIKGRVIHELKTCYEGDKLIAVFGSAGFLEISLPNANCAAFLHAKIGTKVTVQKL